VTARDSAIAFFVTPHGYGHAARAAAVMAAVAQRLPAIRLDLFTTVPRWFFADSLTAPFHIHPVVTDVGLIQRDALTVDFEATVARLRELVPFTAAVVDPLARKLEAAGCRAVVCDISPLGLEVARTLGVPSVLVENFTWDWIYDRLSDKHPALAPFAGLFGELIATADVHLQATPVCRPQVGARTVRPVCRRPRTDPATTRARLGVPASTPMVLVTMGGIPWTHGDLAALERADRVRVVVPGAGDRLERRGSLTVLPHHSELFHPDLVAASDIVVGKLGYSTVAEIYASGCAFAFVPRADFPESPVLAEFCRTHIASHPLAPDALHAHRWLAELGPLLERPRRPPGRSDGAEQIAELVVELAA